MHSPIVGLVIGASCLTLALEVKPLPTTRSMVSSADRVSRAPVAQMATTKQRGELNIPGQSFRAYATLPLRTLLWSTAFSVSYPIALVASYIRAVYMRVSIGLPSQILAKGTHGNVHKEDSHYACQVLFSQPFDEPRLRSALLELCAEDGIGESKVEVKFVDETPSGWPETGSFALSHFVPGSIPEGQSFMDYWAARGGSGKVVRVHVFNGAPGMPTVMLYGGSLNAWDGSSNFNFAKELLNRYVGAPPNAVFASPTISVAAAAQADASAFAPYLLKLPVNLARSLGGVLWNAIRAAEWAGGNGFGFKLTAMNFDEAESEALYRGARALGVSPFACFTYAAHRACADVLGQPFERIVQQANLQTRHFPLPQQKSGSRDLVGEWLVGPVAYAGKDYSLEDAQAGYAALIDDLDRFGPKTQASFMAKAYGLVNCGAAPFECTPTYNDDAHVFDRTLFMNNYGRRAVAPEAAFEAWNWNAPLWLGVNTINVNGKTTTLVGSCMWGLDVVEALRDHMEATLRGIMAKASYPPA